MTSRTLRISVHRRNVFVLLFVALIATPVFTSGVASSAAVSAAHPTGIGLIKWGGGSGSSNNWNELTHTGKYSLITVGPVDAPWATRLPGRTLLYGCGVTVPDASWSGECGVPWTAAVANDWLLKDASGRYVEYPGYDYLYLADIGNPAYQSAWVAAMDSTLRRFPGIKGVWIDNVVGDLIAPSVQYPDSASYREAMLSFLKAVGPALRAKGWYVATEAIMVDTTTPGWRTAFGNECDGAQNLWWYRQIAPDVDGIATEYWQMSWNDGSVRLAGTASCRDQNWDGWQRIIPAVQGMGKDFIPLTSGSSDAAGVAKSTYLKASFLLSYNGGASTFIYAAGGDGNYVANVDDWMAGAPWTLDLGAATGVKQRIGVGWRRNFTGGAVVIDPNPTTSQRFGLKGTYLLPSGAPVTSVTLDPGTALILRRRPRSRRY